MHLHTPKLTEFQASRLVFPCISSCGMWKCVPSAGSESCAARFVGAGGTAFFLWLQSRDQFLPF